MHVYMFPTAASVKHIENYENVFVSVNNSENFLEIFGIMPLY